MSGEGVRVCVHMQASVCVCVCASECVCVCCMCVCLFVWKCPSECVYEVYVRAFTRCTLARRRDDWRWRIRTGVRIGVRDAHISLKDAAETTALYQVKIDSLQIVVDQRSAAISTMETDYKEVCGWVGSRDCNLSYFQYQVSHNLI